MGGGAPQPSAARAAFPSFDEMNSELVEAIAKDLGEQRRR